MFRNASLTVLAAMFCCTTLALAKAPAAAPAGTTGMCKDGTYTSAPSKSGACSGHDGVKKWYGAAAAADAAAPAASGSDTGASSSKSKSKSKSEAAAAAAPAATAPDATSSDMGTTSSKSKKKKKNDAADAASASAAAPAGAATGTCKDGTSTSAASKSGACSGHGGVKDWYAASGGAAAPAAPMTPAPMSPAPMSKAAPAAAAAAPAAAAPAKSGSYTPPATAAPGGGPGQVWVNKSSKVYHCPTDQWYGKTKEGAYMTEADAVAQGYRADHGKACH